MSGSLYLTISEEIEGSYLYSGFAGCFTYFSICQQRSLLVKAILHRRIDALRALKGVENLPIDDPSENESTPLAISANQKTREVSKVLINDLKADIHKTWCVDGFTDSVLASLIRKNEHDELVFFLDEFKVDVNVPIFRDKECQQKTSLLILAIEKDWIR